MVLCHCAETHAVPAMNQAYSGECRESRTTVVGVAYNPNNLLHTAGLSTSGFLNPHADLVSIIPVLAFGIGVAV